LNQKKPINSVAIGVGAICVVLLIAMMAIYLNYNSMLQAKDAQINSLSNQLANAGIQPNPNQTPSDTGDKDSQIATLQNQIADLQSQIANLQSQLTQKNADIDSLNSQIASLNSQINDLKSIMNLQKSTIWVNDQTISQQASSYTVWTVSADYAGYVSVHIESSTVAGTHVKVIYSSHGVSFNQELVVNTGDTASFPILPSSNIQVEVGNGNILNGATETVTITYHY
jgi:DNA repair exonuclease SbcCD ATPase subunit